MILAEIIALLALLGASGIGVTAVISWARRSDADSKDRKRFKAQMQQDLRDALSSRDYKRLDDWMLIYADEMSPAMRKQLEQRRDELFIEADNRR